MCSPIILCRIRYFDLANTGQLLLKCITVLLDFPHNIHIGDISWSSRWCFIEFTCSACSCVAHTIASVSFLRCPSFNYCHVLSVLTFSVYFKNLPKSGITEFRHPFFALSKILVKALHFHIYTFFTTYKPSFSFFSCKMQYTYISSPRQTPIHGH